MIPFQSIFDFFNILAPLELQETYDNSGLLLSSTEEHCTGALLSLDITPKIVEEAIEKKCNLIISHHPILFRPVQKLGHTKLEELIIRRCLAENIALYALHTPLDKIKKGVSFTLAQQLNLQDIDFLQSFDSKVGFGSIGYLPQKMEFHFFLKQIQQLFETPCLRYSQPETDLTLVHKIAFCGGSGAPLIPQAIAQKADVFITADLKYHDFFVPYPQLVLVDVGHYESEKHTISLLYHLCKEKFPIFAWHTTAFNTNPINYLI